MSLQTHLFPPLCTSNFINSTKLKGALQPILAQFLPARSTSQAYLITSGISSKW
jgi:hypothetical protein